MKIKIALSLFLLLAFGAIVFGQDGNGNATGKGGVVFKIPDDVFPEELKKNGFKGMLMLRKDSPAGMFVAYPNDNESLDALRDRLATFIVPMFVHEKAEAEKLVPQKSAIPVHSGDVERSASYYLYSASTCQVQVLFYERNANGVPVIYGYFAKKNTNSKDNAEIKGWADETGQGVKAFDKFWKTIRD